jgi:hypothetical protein
MESYSLLQPELGADIDRRALEEASVAAPNVGRADCARMARELFGIVVSGLPMADAAAFRAALLARNFPTRIAADRDLPRLPAGQYYSRLEAQDDFFTLADTRGRQITCRAEDVLLLAGGFLRRLKNKTELKQVRIPYLDRGADYGWDPPPLLERHAKLEQAGEFRFECFIKRSPYRLRLLVDAGTSVVWNGVGLRLEKRDPIQAFMVSWRRFAPRVRRNLGLVRDGADFEYPSLRAFENEIRWHFYMLREPAGQKNHADHRCS